MQVSIPYTEADLVHSLKRREKNAFEYLYNRYSNALYAAVISIVRNKETAGDILQEVFVKIWQNLDKYDPAKGRLFTWMLNVARNASIDYTRSKLYKIHSRNTAIDESMGNSLNDSSFNIDGVGITRFVSALPSEYRRVIILAYFKGYTQEEIAMAENMPIGTVKTRIRKGLSELKKIL